MVAILKKNLKINHREGTFVSKSIIDIVVQVYIEGSIRRELIGSTWKSSQVRYIGIDAEDMICKKSM